MPSRPVNLDALFTAAHAQGELSSRSLQVLALDADLGAQVTAGLGVDPDDVPASEAVLLTLMPDDSGSIRQAGQAQAVRDGHNSVLAALARVPQASDVLVHTRLLNGAVICPYRALDQAVRLDSKNYRPNLGTPLYDQTAILLATVLAKTQELADAGIPVRTVTLLITDGSDQHSRRQNARSVRSLVTDMLRSEAHLVAGMGIDDGHTDFRKVFRGMGIQDEWILTPGASETELRGAFALFGQSAARHSMGVPTRGASAAPAARRRTAGLRPGVGLLGRPARGGGVH